MGILLQALGLQPHTFSEVPLGDYSADVQPPSRVEPGVTVERAVSLPAAFRSVQILAGMGSQLTLAAWRNGERVNPAPALVTKPDPWRDLAAVLERIIVCLATNGNAFLLKYSNSAGTAVDAIEVLDPTKVFIHFDRRGVKTYDAWVRGVRRTFSAADIEHIWGLQLPGHTRGLSPIEACRIGLSGALDIRDYAGNWFADTDVPSGVLTTDQPIDKAEAKEYKRRWLKPDDDDPDAGRRGPRIRIMGRGLAYEPVTLNPSDAQWLEAQNFGVLDIARMFGIPADYLLASVSGSSLTYQSLAMITGQLLDATLYPVYLRPIQAAFTACLPRGQEARFESDVLRRPDPQTQAAIDKTYVELGVVSREEVRDRIGYTGAPPALSSIPARTPAPAKESAPA